MIGCDRQADEPPCHSQAEYASAKWLNLEVGAEYRAKSGFTLRIAPGYSVLLNPDGWHCVVRGADFERTSCGTSMSGPNIPYINLALGNFVL